MGDAKKPMVKKREVITDEVTPDNVKKGQHAAVATMILQLPEGIWASVIVACAFVCVLIIEGVMFTFGVLIDDVIESFEISYFRGSMVSAVQNAFSYVWSPLASALIHRIGIKATTMTGSVICFVGVFSAYFCESFTAFFLCYAIITGFGSSMIIMPCLMIPRFYFYQSQVIKQTIKTRKSRYAKAVTFAVSGFAVMIFAELYATLDELDNWRTVLLIKASLLGSIYFIAQAFRSLRILTKESDTTTHWQTSGAEGELVEAMALAPGAASEGFRLNRPPAQRPQKPRPEPKPPTDEDEVAEEEEPQSEQEMNTMTIEEDVAKKLNRWEKFENKIETYAEHKREKWESTAKGVYATMIDTSLLRWPSFLMLCFCCMFSNLGILIPYTYLPLRNFEYGLSKSHSERLLSVIGASNLIGRLLIGGGQLGERFDPTMVHSVTLVAAAVATILSDVSLTVFYQYVYAIVFGFFAAGQSGVRIDCVIKLYGLEKLTHGMGALHMCLGLGSFTGKTSAGMLVDAYGYQPPFILASACMLASAVIMVLVKILAVSEEHKKNKEEAERINV